MSKERETLEQIERRMQRKIEFDEWSIKKNRDFLAAPFNKKVSPQTPLPKK